MIGIINSVRDAQGAEVLTVERLCAVQTSAIVTQTSAALRSLHAEWERGAITREEYKARASGLKKRLPALTPHAVYPDRHRTNAGAVPTGFCLLDIEEAHLKAKNEELRMKNEESSTGGVGAAANSSLFILNSSFPKGLVWARKSASGFGLQLILRIPPGMGIEQAQAHYAQLLGVGYDVACKDLARAAFLTPPEYDLFRDDTALFCSRTATAAMAYLDCHPVAVGSRNNTLFAAAAHAKRVTKADLKELTAAMVVVNTWALGDNALPEVEVHAIAANANKMKNEELRMKNAAPATAQGTTRNSSLFTLRSSLFTLHSSLPSDLPKDLPPLMALLTRNVPEHMRPAVAAAVFPPLAAHLVDTIFALEGSERHEATLSTILMAPMAAGKSCVDAPIEAIIADIRERDATSRALEDVWKADCRKKGPNAARPARPEGIIIQCVQPNITLPALVMRMKEARGRFLYCRMNEIDNLNHLGAEKFNIINHAFDYGNRWGQVRVSPDAVSEEVTVRLNFNASTVDTKGIRFFARDLETGPVSRLSFATIERQVGPRPLFGPYDEAFHTELRPYIERLNAAHGTFVIPEADALRRELDEEYITLYNSGEAQCPEALPALCPRAVIIAWLKACVLYIAHGQQWSDEIAAFTRWAYHYDMECKLRFFGAALQTALTQNPLTQTTPALPATIATLPPIFTLDDLIEAYAAQGKTITTEAAQGLTRQWVARGHITRNTDSTFSHV